jgi:Flp pilus assembly protein TadG
VTARRWRRDFLGLGDVVPRRMTAQALAEFAVVSVVFLSMMVSVVDLALWLHAQNVVLSASQEAATVGSRENASAEQAVTAARNLLQAGLGSAAAGIDTVNVDIGPDVTTADVRGTWYVAPLGPLVPVPVHARTSMLREQFRPGGR